MNWLRIAVCDTRRVLKDKSVIIWWLIMPVAFAYLFGMVIGRPDQRIWLPVVNLDNHELSKVFIEQLKTPDFSVSIHPAMEENIKKWGNAIILPATFSTAILAGQKVKCSIVQGYNSNPEKVLAVQSDLVRAITKLSASMASVDSLHKEWNENSKNELLQELKKTPLLSAEKGNHPYLRPPPSGRAYTLPTYLIMFVLINAIMFGGITLTYERQFKQLIRLQVSPLHPAEIFLGKMTGRMLQPMIQSTVLLFVGKYFMGVPFGDHPMALIPVVFCFSACCGAFGILFGSICRTEQQVFGLGMLVAQTLCALGGCWWPMEIAPEYLKTVAMYTPTYWGLHALQNVMAFGKSFEGVYTDCFILLIFTAIILAISIPLFRRMQNV